MGIMLLAGQPALADDSDWYVGLGGGRSLSRLNDDKITNELTTPGYDSATLDRSDHENTYKVFGGFQFDKYFSTEISYFDLGKFRWYTQDVPLGGTSSSLDVRGFALDAVGILPLTDKFSAFAKLGASEARSRFDFSSSDGAGIGTFNSTEWHVNPKVGAGLQYLFAEHFALRAEWERYRISDAASNHGNVDSATISVVFPFGRSSPPPVVSQPPAPTPAPEEAPPVVAQAAPAPAPVVHKHVTFDADTLFTFNTSTLRPEGYRALDKFVAELKTTTFSQVHVLGYTDRIGSDAYNQKLSQRRADAVKAYLVDSAGVDASKVDAEGKGKSNPITQPGQCGAGRSKATIACLQPDRRVDIEVAGVER
jgi:OOP family OmpA-OmpF porin